LAESPTPDFAAQLLLALEVVHLFRGFLKGEQPASCLPENVVWVVLPPFELLNEDAGRTIEHYAWGVISLSKASPVPLFERVDMGNSVSAGRRNLPFGKTGCRKHRAIGYEREAGGQTYSQGVEREFENRTAHLQHHPEVIQRSLRVSSRVFRKGETCLLGERKGVIASK
jgi:hypothetical protein